MKLRYDYHRKQQQESQPYDMCLPLISVIFIHPHPLMLLMPVVKTILALACPLFCLLWHHTSHTHPKSPTPSQSSGYFLEVFCDIDPVSPNQAQSACWSTRRGWSRRGCLALIKRNRPGTFGLRRSGPEPVRHDPSIPAPYRSPPIMS